ncbi:MAG: hypothetical protein ACO1Q7_15395 [Gemmatimonas sp.]
MRRSALAAAALALTLAPARETGAQQMRIRNEFTKQGLLIVNFGVASGTEQRFARQSASEVRSRVSRL